MSANFIEEIVAKDLANGVYSKITTRFPPEPNGYLHIGHAKSICLNFGLAREFKGTCNLRMDDTNPSKESQEYVGSIEQDVRWLINGWADHCLGLEGEGPYFASNYFDVLYKLALQLIESGDAYVCHLSAEEMEKSRGAPYEAGKDSPYRNRSVEENLSLFKAMRHGDFPDGHCTLRARIDMSSPNIWLRDPVLYRIKHVEHHNTGGIWCIYPMYDYAHCLSDYVEGITHSICTLEFEVHRPLYDWILAHLKLPNAVPHQYEFSRLNLSHTIMSKRKLLELVTLKHVWGWDAPRLPAISGLRRRGFPAVAVRNFVMAQIGRASC